jgi:hypothetical protein
MGDKAASKSTSEAQPGVPQPHTVAAEQREYAAASSAWFSAVVHQVMGASDSIHADISMESVEELPGELVQPTGEEDPMVVKPLKVEASGTVTVPGIVEGDLDDLHAMVATTAEQMLAQTMAAMFAQIGEVSDRVGNTVEARNGDLIEAYIEAIEKTDIRFDDQGRPQFQVAAGPEMAERFRQQFAAMTPEQARRVDAALTKKREVFNAARRRRRLPRHGD